MHFRFKPRRNPGSQSQHRSVNRTVVGIHLNFAVKLSNNVGPSQYLAISELLTSKDETCPSLESSSFNSSLSMPRTSEPTRVCSEISSSASPNLSRRASSTAERTSLLKKIESMSEGLKRSSKLKVWFDAPRDSTELNVPKSTKLPYHRSGASEGTSTLWRNKGKNRVNVLLPLLFRPTKTVMGLRRMKPVFTRLRKFFNRTDSMSINRVLLLRFSEDTT